jgi:hypothetical protein
LALNLVELRIQFDRLEVIMPVGGRYLERHVDGRFGRGARGRRRRITPRAVAETRCDTTIVPRLCRCARRHRDGTDLAW